MDLPLEHFLFIILQGSRIDPQLLEHCRRVDWAFDGLFRSRRVALREVDQLFRRPPKPKRWDPFFRLPHDKCGHNHPIDEDYPKNDEVMRHDHIWKGNACEESHHTHERERTQDLPEHPGIDGSFRSDMLNRQSHDRSYEE